MSISATPSQSQPSHGGARRSLQVPPHLHSLAALALLLEKLERQPRDASPGQYRHVVEQLGRMLGEVGEDEALHTLLDFFPATGELWENLHYDHAGLCRAPVEQLAETELQTRELLQRLSRHPAR